MFEAYYTYHVISYILRSICTILYNVQKNLFLDKLSALLEDKRASKLTEKIFTIYDDTKASQKNKKRSHPEDKDKDKDAKKSRFKDDETKNEKPIETQLSADKVL